MQTLKRLLAGAKVSVKVPFDIAVAFIAAHPKASLALWAVSLVLAVRYL